MVEKDMVRNGEYKFVIYAYSTSYTPPFTVHGVVVVVPLYYSKEAPHKKVMNALVTCRSLCAVQ